MGTSYGILAPLIFAFARTMRWARVGARRVATGENQPQPVVDDVVILGIAELERHIRLTRHLAARLAQPVDGLETPRGNEPGARIGRRAVHRPALHRRRERVLKRLLGEIEVAEQADQSGENATGFRAVDRLDRVYGWLNSMIGRTSTVPCLAPGIRDATCTASFRSFALMR